MSVLPVEQSSVTRSNPQKGQKRDIAPDLERESQEQPGMEAEQDAVADKNLEVIQQQEPPEVVVEAPNNPDFVDDNSHITSIDGMIAAILNDVSGPGVPEEDIVVADDPTPSSAAPQSASTPGLQLKFESSSQAKAVTPKETPGSDKTAPKQQSKLR